MVRYRRTAGGWVVAGALPLSEWHTFNAVVGSAAGALTGLMFVATALMHGQRLPSMAIRLRSSFASPTIVHFTVVLAFAGILSMPRLPRATTGLILTISGGALVLYAIWVILNARRYREIYEPDLEDQFWHFTLPLLAYASIFAGGISYWLSMNGGMYAVAGGMVALLVIGIHNAWDSVTWQVFRRSQELSE
jgi:hypothetical protein